MILIAIFLLFGGIGYLIRATIVGTMKMFLPTLMKRKPSTKPNHDFRNGVVCIFVTILIFVMYLT